MAYAPDSVWAQSKAARLLCTSAENLEAMLTAQRAHVPQNAADVICDELEALRAR